MNTRDFITAIFGDLEGYLFISSKSDSTNEEVDVHKSFSYPAGLDQLLTYVEMRADEDVYFSPMLYSVPRRKASAVSFTPVVYADTDSFDIDKYLIAPSINVATSEGKHASFWLLDDNYTPDKVSTVARTIALTHSWKEDGKQMGVDAGGWDLSQLLRLPNSKNLKYQVDKFKGDYHEAFDVHVDVVNGNVYSLDEMIEAYQPENIPESPKREHSSMPEDLPEAKDVLARITASKTLSDLYSNEPKGGQDWSDTLYFFVSEMFRNGFTPEEVLVGAWYAACNKYRRDKRPMSDLWEYDVSKAMQDPANRPRPVLDREASDTPDFKPKDEGLATALEVVLLREAERGMLSRTFVDDYVEWGSSRTDAPAPYHVASAFTILSCVLGEHGVAYPQYGMLRLGMFFIIMGETTDTRKSTTRNLMKKFINFLNLGGEDEGYVLNGDTTPETLLDDLSERAHKSSLYDRDEAQQLIHDIKNKGYLRGFFETLNELYDGKAHGRSRQNKKTKDTEVNFVQYLMGIRSQIQDNLEVSDFASGYLPRNIFVRGESPPRTKETNYLKQGNPAAGRHDPLFLELTGKMLDVRSFWQKTAPDPADPMPIIFEDDAWDRWNDFAWDLTQYVGQHPRAEILKPSVQRLAAGVLKAAVMFAMMDKRTVGNMSDVINAIYYGAQWVEDLIIVAEGVSASVIQRDLDKFVELLNGHKGLMTFAAVNRWASKEGKGKRDIAELIERLEDSDIIRVVEDSKGKKSIELL